MRLLNTGTLELHEFFDGSIPKYAILSHRWEAGEVSFQDVTQRLNLDAPGWTKIRNFCHVARENGYKWAWVDTCSIDKTSSSELSEAINSMYKWYQNAEVCFVYFCDVECEAQDVLEYDTIVFGWLDYDIRCSKSTTSALRGSQWFTRGWTLQELIAPREAVFLDRQWRIFGSKCTFKGMVSAISGVEHIAHLDSYRHSIATKMSWASNRHCTRPEDIAYSLMGLFNVNMPLLYGEGGRNAFLRLQLEILKGSDDESIFAWYPMPYPHASDSMLAVSPQAFAQCSKIRSFVPTVQRQPYAMTNNGLEITTVILSSKADSWQHYLPLNCYKANGVSPLAIPLVQIRDGSYQRVNYTEWDNPLWLPEERHLEITRPLSKIYITNNSMGNFMYGPPENGTHEEEAMRKSMDRYLSL